MAAKKFICKVCGYVHTGDAAPEKCPTCQAPSSEFVEQKRGGMFDNKNSNAYIIMYSTVMVVIVAVLLAVAALALKSRQDANILNEKKNAILASLGEENKTYNDFITAYAVDTDGNRIDGIDGDNVIGMLSDLPTAIENKTFPVFESVDHRYVIPVTGRGLWNTIWGYVALADDMNTISGIVLDHSGETPGLGAEISGKPHHILYEGKKIFEGDEFVSVKLRKGGATQANIDHEVDAITGGTKTSDGVTTMLYDCLLNYVPFFESHKVQTAPAEAAEQPDAETSNAEMSNEITSESNE